MESSAPPTAATAAATKAEEISMVLSEPEVNLWKLREMAISEGGLVNDMLRQRAWPKLVGLKGDGTENNSNGGLHPSPSEASLVSMDSKYSSESFANDGFGVMDPAQLASKVRKTSSTTGGAASTLVVARSDDADQVERDIARCTWHLLSGAQRSRRRQMENKHRKKIATILKRKQRKLGNLINLTLLKSYHQDVTVPGEMGEEDDVKLRYYQGYHDVACIFLNVLGGASTAASSSPLTPSSSSSSLGGQSASFATSELPTTVANLLTMDLAVDVLLQISKSHLRDAMRCNFQQLTNALRLVTMPLIGAFDAEVHSHLYYADMEPFFCLSWVITWFSHDVRNTTLVKRLFDVFVASHPLMPIYVAVAMVLHPYNRQEILRSDCDFAVVHNLLSSLPRNSCSIGWKFKGSDEGGYVSTEEDEEEEQRKEFDETASLDKSMLSEDFSLKRASSTETDNSGIVVAGASSTDEGVLDPATSYKVGTTGKVPFEDLITTAIQFMRRIPPRKLAALARKYHTDPMVTPLLGETSSIALLQPPPTWGLASKIPSDWTLKQQARERRGVGGQRRKRRSSSQSQLSSQDDKNGHPEQQLLLPKSKPVREMDLNSRAAKNNFAVIASGMGPDGEEEERQRRRLKMLLWGGVAVALISVSVYVVMSSGFPLTPPTLDFGKDPPAAADAPSTLERADGADTERTTSTPSPDVAVDDRSEASEETAKADEVDDSLSLGDLTEELTCSSDTGKCAGDDAPSTTEDIQVDPVPPTAVEVDSRILATSTVVETEGGKVVSELGATEDEEEVSELGATEDEVSEQKEEEFRGGTEANITLGDDSDLSMDEPDATLEESTVLSVEDSKDDVMDPKKEAEATNLVKPVAFVRLPTKSVEAQINAGKSVDTTHEESTEESIPEDGGIQSVSETVPRTEDSRQEDRGVQDDLGKTETRTEEKDVTESVDVPSEEEDLLDGDEAPVEVDGAGAVSNVSHSDDRTVKGYDSQSDDSDDASDFESTKDWSEDEATAVDISSSDRSLDLGEDVTEGSPEPETRVHETAPPTIADSSKPDGAEPGLPTQRQRRAKTWRKLARGVGAVLNVVRGVVEDANYLHLAPSFSPRNKP